MIFETYKHTIPCEWEELVALDKNSSFFHTSFWLQSLIQAFPKYCPVTIFLKNSQGNIKAGIIGFGYYKWGFYNLHSLPFGTYGGILQKEKCEAAEITSLIKKFFDISKGARAGEYIIHTYPYMGKILNQDDNLFKEFKVLKNTAHLLFLEGLEPDDFLKKYIDKSHRYSIRKAKRVGVQVKKENNPEAVKKFYRILLEASSRWGLNTYYPEELFYNLITRQNEYCSNSSIRPEAALWLAYFQEQAVAGILCFYFRDQIIAWSGSILKDYTWTCGFNLLVWETILDGLKKGFKWYNMGASKGLHGVESFKTSFGATPYEYSDILYHGMFFSLLKTIKNL